MPGMHDVNTTQHGRLLWHALLSKAVATCAMAATMCNSRLKLTNQDSILCTIPDPQKVHAAWLNLA